MIDYYLKFENQQQALEVMQSFTYTDDEGTRLTQGNHQWALWEVGEIPGKDGWHINLRVIDPELDVSEIETYTVKPTNPVCVWA